MNIKAVVTGLILTIIGIIVVFNILGATATDLQAAGTNVSGSGLPLAGLFSGSGVVMLVFMAGVLIAIIAAAMKMGGSK